MARLRLPARGQLAAGAAAAAGGLAVAATQAFACSAVMGPLSFSPASGPPGTVVRTTASGLKPYPAKYDLFFDGTCMTFSGKLLKTITTTSTGGWTNVKVAIPKNAPIGVHALCGIEVAPNAGATDTSHNSWTVT